MAPSRWSRPRHSKPSSMERPLVCRAKSGSRNRFTSAFRDRPGVPPLVRNAVGLSDTSDCRSQLAFHTQHSSAWYDGLRRQVKITGVIKVIEGCRGCRRKIGPVYGLCKPMSFQKSRFQPPTSSVPTSQGLGSNLPKSRIQPPTALGSNLPQSIVLPRRGFGQSFPREKPAPCGLRLALRSDETAMPISLETRLR